MYLVSLTQETYSAIDRTLAPEDRRDARTRTLRNYLHAAYFHGYVYAAVSAPDLDALRAALTKYRPAGMNAAMRALDEARAV